MKMFDDENQAQENSFIYVIAEYLQKVDPKSDGAKWDWVAIYDECAAVLYQIPGLLVIMILDHYLSKRFIANLIVLLMFGFLGYMCISKRHNLSCDKFLQTE
ncbi:ABC2 isoform [Arachis hypogaea]|nr:ABC2 isoform [Arachis hypogaea]